MPTATGGADSSDDETRFCWAAAAADLRSAAVAVATVPKSASTGFTKFWCGSVSAGLAAVAMAAVAAAAAAAAAATGVGFLTVDDADDVPDAAARFLASGFSLVP